MIKPRLALGLDVSTQSLSAVVLDIDEREKLIELSLDYLKDERLNSFGIREPDYILPPRTEGEADQPPLMFLAALDSVLFELKKSVPLEKVAVINISGQQHGHVYLNSTASSGFAVLNRAGSEASNLTSLLKDSLAYERAPIWMTADTGTQASFIRNNSGGKERLIKLSGSDAPLRFTGLVIRRTAENFPDIYERTSIIQLISSFIPAALTGNANVAVDFGNACGMSLMNYRSKRWSDTLLQAASRGLPGGKNALRTRLPEITAPDATAGRIAEYFVNKYGFNRKCLIVPGSGDNPQSKVLISGDLLSLGSSFVFMVATDGKTIDRTGAACAMYDGIGRPFMFGCRTNGALVWDQLRALYGMHKEDYAPAEATLKLAPVGQNMVLWQPRDESFPSSGKFDLTRLNNYSPDLAGDYAGIIESSLAAVYYHSKSFSRSSGEPLYVTGGATGSPSIMRRVAAIWNRPLVMTGKGGAALGAAVAGISAYYKSTGEEFKVEEYSEAVLPRGEMVEPKSEDVSAFHSPGGYLDRFAKEEAGLIKKYPPG
ncbi:FGGY family carbohydrate kinase [Chloroflexota bacterium]